MTLMGRGLAQIIFIHGGFALMGISPKGVPRPM